VGQRYIKPERIAIATESGEFVDACFGKVNQYRIYVRTEEGYRLEEIRPGLSLCQDKHHDQDLLQRTAELLSDCQMVLAGRIGPAAIQALSSKGVTGLAVSISLNEALEKLHR
jgi:predicted Fe-Mo cluster-binding NifX family protein